MTTYHVSLSVRGALRWPRRRLLRLLTDSAGRDLSPARARDVLLDHLSRGHEVLPIGAPCEGWDWQTGCPGHPAGDDLSP